MSHWYWLGPSKQAFINIIKDVTKSTSFGMEHIWIQIPAPQVGDLDNPTTFRAFGVLIYKCK
jgi:hypothetical protein